MTFPIIGIAAGRSPAAAHAIEENIRNAAPGQNVVLSTLPFKSCGEDPVQAAADRKIHLLETARELVARGAGLCLVPEPGMKAARQEAAELVAIRFMGPAEALASQTAGRTVGILAPRELHEAIMEEFAGANLVFLSPRAGEALAEVVRSLADGGSRQAAAATFSALCQEFATAGADCIVSFVPQLSALAAEGAASSLRIADAASALAAAALACSASPAQKPFKLGIVGGLGPAATVDLYDKITKATPAKTDQEHIKIAIEQNPQCPDRTGFLLQGGKDPTLTLFNSCRILAEDGCDAIIFPCNTAHAFRARIQPHIPCRIMNMQEETIRAIKDKLGEGAVVGLLATSGTIATRIYHRIAEELGVTLVTPDEKHQAMVMDAIYGPEGAKAGFTRGHCWDALMAASEYLVQEKGAGALILGCTELPLIFAESDAFPVAGRNVVVIDPTCVIARAAVKLALETNRARGTR